MTEFSALQAAVIAVTFIAAGVVKGVTGMGLPLVAMSILSTILQPAAAAALLIVPSFVTNVWQLFAGPDFKALALRLSLMMAGITIGAIAASGLLTSGSSGWTRVAFGATLIAYSSFSLLARQLYVPPHLERVLSPVIGLVTGVITGATGVFTVPAVPYLQALGLEKDDLIQALGLSFTVSTIALAIGLGSRGAFSAASIGVSTVVLVPALAGMWVGQRIRRLISPVRFRQWFLVFLLILGFHQVLHPLI